MGGRVKTVLCACALFSVIFSVPVVSAQENQNGSSTQESSGEIVSVDSKASTLSIKRLADETTQSYDTDVFSVEKSASISKGNLAMILSDLKPGDKVTFVYFETPEGKEIIRSISVTEEE